MHFTYLLHSIYWHSYHLEIIHNTWQEKIIGTGTLLDANIQSVFILPTYQRKGLGKLIMQKLEKQALVNDINSLNLTSTPVSKGFYDSIGYTTSKQDYFTVGTKQKFRYYKMIKKQK